MADLQSQGTYTALGWDFSHVWIWDALAMRPKLRDTP
jgi:hypothetical protein